MNTKMKEIASGKALLEVLDSLHDATCNEEEIKYDPEKGTMDIFFDQECLEKDKDVKVKRLFLVLYKHEFPIVKRHLHVEGMAGFKMHSNDKSLKVHTVNECKAEGNKYLLKFCEVLRIEIEFKSAITGYLKDMGPIEGKTGSFISFRR